MKLNLSFLLLLFAPALAVDMHCELGYVSKETDFKCPFGHEDRLDRIPKDTVDACYEHCKDTTGCVSFSYGGEGVENPDWQGLCMLCQSEENLEPHYGFNTYSMIKKEE